MPLALLIVVGVVLWRLARWARPKADKVLDGMIANSGAMPGILEANAARDRAQQQRDEALLAAVGTLTTLVGQLAERVSAQSQRGQLIAEHVSRQTTEFAELSQRIAAALERMR